jgi:hypothetical protein
MKTLRSVKIAPKRLFQDKNTMRDKATPERYFERRGCSLTVSSQAFLGSQTPRLIGYAKCARF